MATKIDWVDDSLEFQKALDKLGCFFMEYSIQEELSQEQGTSLVRRLAATLAASMLDERKYKENAILGVLFGEDAMVSLTSDEITKVHSFVEVQTEMFKYLLEHEIARTFNTDVDKIRRRTEPCQQ